MSRHSFLARYIQMDWYNKTVTVTPLPEDEEQLTVDEIADYLSELVRQGPDELEVLARTFKDEEN